VATGIIDGTGQYLMEVHAQVPAHATVACGQASNNGQLWPRRFAHLGADNMDKLPALVRGMDMAAVDASTDSGALCHPCVEARMTRAPLQPATNKATSVLELVHVDVAGPVVPASKGGARFSLAMVDDHTAYKAVALLKTKGEAGVAMRTVINKW